MWKEKRRVKSGLCFHEILNARRNLYAALSRCYVEKIINWTEFIIFLTHFHPLEVRTERAREKVHLACDADHHFTSSVNLTLKP